MAIETVQTEIKHSAEAQAALREDMATMVTSYRATALDLTASCMQLAATAAALVATCTDPSRSSQATPMHAMLGQMMQLATQSRALAQLSVPVPGLEHGHTASGLSTAIPDSTALDGAAAPLAAVHAPHNYSHTAGVPAAAPPRPQFGVSIAPLPGMPPPPAPPSIMPVSQAVMPNVPMAMAMPNVTMASPWPAHGRSSVRPSCTHGTASHSR